MNQFIGVARSAADDRGKDVAGTADVSWIRWSGQSYLLLRAGRPAAKRATGHRESPPGRGGLGECGVTELEGVLDIAHQLLAGGLSPVFVMPRDEGIRIGPMTKVSGVAVGAMLKILRSRRDHRLA